MYLVIHHWGIAVVGAAVGFMLPTKVLDAVLGTLFVMFAWRAWSAIPVFALAYLVWNVGRRRWDNDADPETVPWYARYCHGAWHVLTAYGMWMVRVG